MYRYQYINTYIYISIDIFRNHKKNFFCIIVFLILKTDINILPLPVNLIVYYSIFPVDISKVEILDFFFKVNILPNESKGSFLSSLYQGYASGIEPVSFKYC